MKQLKQLLKMNSMHQKWIFLVLIIFLYSSMQKVNAQASAIPPSYYNNTGTTSNTIPLNFTSNKCHFIYGPNVFRTAGLTGTLVPAGQLITKVWIKFSGTTNAANAIANFKIFMGQNVGTATQFTSTTYNTGLTQVFNASTFTFTGIAANNWYGITLPTPFAYDPSLSLVIDLNTTSTSSGNSIAYVTTTGLNQRLYGAVASPTGTSGTGLLHFGFDVVSAAPCTSPPTAGSATTTNATPCPNVNFDLGIIGGTSGSGQTYQWYSSPDNITYSPIAGATNAVYTTSQAVSKYYKCDETCSGFTATTAPLLVTTSGTPLSGTYTINQGAAASSTNFQSFTAFKTAINCVGISGPVIVDVVANSGPYTEQVEFGVISGVSAINTITINGNGNTLTYAATVSTAPGTLILNGTDYMTVNNMIVVGTGATYALVCHLWNQADNNTFTGCTFNAPANGTATTQVPFSVSGSETTATTATGASGNNNKLDGCTMFSGYYNTCFVGNSTTPCTGNQVLNCNIRDQYFYGSYNLYQNGMVISGNTVERPTRTTLSSFYGIYLSTGCSNMLVEKNRIRNPYATTITSTSLAYCIYNLAAATLNNENRIYNNLVSDIQSSGVIYGIYNTGAYAQIYQNTVALDHTAATGTTTTNGIYVTGSAGVIVKNNVVSITRGSTGAKYCLYFTQTTTVSNNNELYANTSVNVNNNIGFYVAGFASLTNWKTANANAWDQQSISEDPAFVSPATGDYTPGSSTMNINDAGAPLGITTDILGATRSATSPDPGAFEFSTGGCSGTPTAGTTSSTASQICPNTLFTLSLIGTSIGSGLTFQWESSPDNFTWTPIVGALSSSLSTTQTVSTYYHCIVVCNGGFSDVSSGLQVITTASPLSGNYTINSGVATGGNNYQTFNALIADLNCAGVTGPVTIDVVSGTGPYNEQVQFGQIAGVSAINTITINGNGNTLTYAATLAAAPGTLVLNGTDYLTVNNLNVVGTGATYALACHLWNQADNNQFNGCTFSVPANATATTQVPFSLSGSATTATTSGVSGNNNIIDGCTMNSGYYNTCIVGNSAGVNTGNKVINSNLLDFYFYGSYNLYNNGTVISNNIIERPTRTTLSTFYGVYLSTSCSNTLVEKNRIRNSFATTLTSTSSTYGIYNLAAATVNNENKIVNNIIYDIKSNGLIYGIYNTGAYANIYHNSIILDHVASTGTAVTYGIYPSAASGVTVKNNIVYISRGGTGDKFCLYFTQTTTVCNYNDLYMNASAGISGIGFYVAAFTTLNDWKTANANAWDQQSVSQDPVFISPSTGDFTPSNSSIDNAGTPIASITTDILGATRSTTTPDVGAIEFTVPANDLSPIAFLTPVSGLCYSNTESVSVNLKNYGSAVIDYFITPATLVCDISGVLNTTITHNLTGTLGAGSTMAVTIPTTIDMTTLGNYTFSCHTTLVGDANPSNDNLAPITRVSNLLAGSISASATSLCFSGSPVLTLSGNVGGSVQWKSSTTSASGPWTNVGNGTSSYTSTITQTTYYMVDVTCNSTTLSSNVISVNVDNPTVTPNATTPLCAGNPASLSATANGNYQIDWYTVATGGTSIQTGPTYTTPNLATTTTYYVEANNGGAGGGTASPLLVTELDLGSNDAVEIQNVSPYPVNVTGWKVYASNSYTDITSVNLNVQTLSGTMAPGEMKTWTDLSSAANYWGSNLFWNPGAYPSFTGWFAIVDNNNQLRDLVVMNWPTANISAANVTLGGNVYSFGSKWSGDGVNIATVAATNSVSRQGNLDNNNLSDFNIPLLSINTTNSAMSLPFLGFGCASTRVPVVVTVNPAVTAGITNNTGASVISCANTSINVTATGGTSYAWSGGSTPTTAANSFSSAGTYTVTATGVGGCSSTATIAITGTPCATTLDLKFYIQGYYLGAGTMTSTIQNEDLDPITAPNYASTDCDSVTITLHEDDGSTLATYPVVGTYTGMLHTNGTISCTFPGSTLTKSCYIVIEHRNSIQTWSKLPITIAATNTYDFSTAATKALGDNQIDVASEGIYSIYNGDINLDFSTDASDFLIMDMDIQSFNSGYISTDLNGDGATDASDFLILDGNIQSFIGAVILP